MLCFRLFVDSGRDQPICIAEETENGASIIRPIADAVIAELQERKIDVLSIDPFVSSHAISENDNRAIDMVAKEWSRIADICDCAINLVHHVRKTNGAEVTAESSRGAVSLIGAARSAGEDAISLPTEGAFSPAILREVIRQGLIGGNKCRIDGIEAAVSPLRANALIERYLSPGRPKAELLIAKALKDEFRRK